MDSSGGEGTLTDLEREVLEEYVKLKENLDKVRKIRLRQTIYPPISSDYLSEYPHEFTDESSIADPTPGWSCI